MSEKGFRTDEVADGGGFPPGECGLGWEPGWAFGEGSEGLPGALTPVTAMVGKEGFLVVNQPSQEWLERGPDFPGGSMSPVFPAWSGRVIVLPEFDASALPAVP